MTTFYVGTEYKVPLLGVIKDIEKGTVDLLLKSGEEVKVWLITEIQIKRLERSNRIRAADRKLKFYQSTEGQLYIQKIDG